MTPRNWIQMMPTAEVYWINRVLYDVQHNPEAATRFKTDPEGYMHDLPLSEKNRQSLLRNDIGQLFLVGANPYLLRAHCLQLRVPEQEYLDALRAVEKEAYHG